MTECSELLLLDGESLFQAVNTATVILTVESEALRNLNRPLESIAFLEIDFEEIDSVFHRSLSSFPEDDV